MAHFKFNSELEQAAVKQRRMVKIDPVNSLSACALLNNQQSIPIRDHPFVQKDKLLYRQFSLLCIYIL